MKTVLALFLTALQLLIAATTTTNPNFQQLKNYNDSESGQWKLKVVHVDRILPSNSFRNRSHRFHARMQRDGKRVANLIHRLPSGSGSTNYKVEALRLDVMPGIDLGTGEYLVRIGVGSPPRSKYLVIDTGSDVIWIQCQPCNLCYTQSDPIFDPADSTSYTHVSCSSKICERLDKAGCHAGQCQYKVNYYDGSYTEGTFVLESLTFGQTVFQNVAIGCGHKNHGLFIGADGLLGLGGGSISFVGQSSSQYGGAFSYRLPSADTNSFGSLEFGLKTFPVGATWAPLFYNHWAPSHYYIGLVGLGVGGIRVPISEDIFQLTGLGDGGVLIDTGTVVTRFPLVAYEALRDAYMAQTANLPRASKMNAFDPCYSLLDFGSVPGPNVSFYFFGGSILTIPPKNVLIPVDDVGTFCFAFLPTLSKLSIIGNVQQEGIQIYIDSIRGYVGFGP